MRRPTIRSAAAALCLLACPLSVPAQTVSAQNRADPLKYPETRTTDVTDDYHGNVVADPYRWLEDTESKETAEWVAAQNRVTEAYLESLPQREPMRKRLEQLWNYERYGLPRPRGEHYFYTHNDGLQNQSVMYIADSLEAKRRVFIDPNQFSEDGTVALAGTAITDDGKYVAYALADGGSDWRTWKVRDVASGKDTDDVVRWVKFSSVAWLPDNSGFFYSRYSEPVEGAELTGTNENQRMYFHSLGSDQSEDDLIIERPDHPKWGFSPIVTDDGRYLVVQNWKGSEPKSQVFFKDLRRPDAEVQPLITGFDAEYDFVASVGDTMYFLTDHEAPRRRIIAVDTNAPQRDQWREVVAESEDVIQSASLFDETFYVDSLRDARSRVTRHTIAGELIDELALPGVGSVSGFGGRQDATETFFSFTNYVTPGAIYRVDLSDGSTSLWRQSEIAIDVDAFVTEQIFCTSKDGTRVPIIVTRRKDSKLDGTNQTLLYAYGGFNISLTPSFSPANAAWVDAGGVYAVANLRGGGEYGRQWHEDGMRLKKQNVFDDFIAAAEHLVQAGYTTKSRLGIRGGSNGGLLVGAVMTQRPDLFGACLPAVGVMDMLRYQKFTIGWAWVTEFGSSDEADQIENLLSYSPLHNLKPGTCYPATLITTADRDDRVVPGHSFKFAAALQAAQGCENPTLIRIETRAGHGAGTPVSKRIEEYADLWAFLQANLQD
ncbi:S9 family peptidase [Roseiconus nitratireducens]|uniref:prolyl oligopeptidase n=1 Tax=Roseiconus nitratireducens TaxID=2605748 RepID=A0A5M6CXN5_9BACT|nr:prolyl oligopeptidase family serine peptidase [Roseiconus nitratireducens]KAA5538762.1 S9 family peptidase [Roseiconus nitratireducens]